MPVIDIDKDLHAQFSAGDPAAFRALVDAYFPVLCRYAQKILQDEALAKDIVQETFIKLWKYEGSFSTSAGLRGFLYVATRNGCLNLLRGRERDENRHLKLAAESPDFVDPVLNGILEAESIALIYQVVRDMPKKMQQVFFLSFEEGLTIAEIAKQMNTSQKTVRNQKYKAVLSLRKKFRNPEKPLLILLSLLLR
jgi:RNA polymerase sigma-70 factor (ECF subfamily)